jgi:hypothetical protein
MNIIIYSDKEKTQKLYDMPLADYLLITANELWGKHWQSIEHGDIEIRKQNEE